MGLWTAVAAEYGKYGLMMYSVEYVGAYTRSADEFEALEKFKDEIPRYILWSEGRNHVGTLVLTNIVQAVPSGLHLEDADSEILLDSDRPWLGMGDYTKLKELAMKSARDFQMLYDSIPDKDKSNNSPRKTFYGDVPRTAREMYEHTKNVNSYYFGEIGVEASNDGDIVSCREAGFLELEKNPDFLQNTLYDGTYGEEWTLRKLLRRFIWHDRIHAKAMFRMAERTFGEGTTADPFFFGHKYDIPKKEEKEVEDDGFNLWSF